MKGPLLRKTRRAQDGTRSSMSNMAISRQLSFSTTNAHVSLGLMKRLQRLVCGAFVVAVVAFLKAQDVRETSAPCPTKNTPVGWKTYVSPAYGFCLSYPPIYKPSTQPWATGDPITSRIARKAADDGRLLRLLHRQVPAADIVVLVDLKPFDLQSFVAGAPTGLDSPPSPVKFGNKTFYYYGPGGGGVAYADRFYYDLRGKTLTIDFDGPFINDKTPSAATKAIEAKMLATFRTF